MLEQFLEDRQRRGCAEKTVSWYRWALSEWVAFGGDSANYHEFLGLYKKPATRRAMWSAVRAYERWRCQSLGLEDWTANVTLHTAPTPDVRPLSHDEFLSVTAQLDPHNYRQHRDKTLLDLLYYTGARRDAIRLLHRRDVDMRAGIIRIHTKGGVIGDVALAGPAIESLLTWLPRVPCDVLFPSTRDPMRAVCGSWITHLVPTLAKQAGIERRVWVHQLRHSCATELVERGVPIEVIQRQLLHRSQSSTLRYAQVSTNRVSEAVNKAWE